MIVQVVKRAISKNISHMYVGKISAMLSNATKTTCDLNVLFKLNKYYHMFSVASLDDVLVMYLKMDARDDDHVQCDQRSCDEE